MSFLPEHLVLTQTIPGFLIAYTGSSYKQRELTKSVKLA